MKTYTKFFLLTFSFIFVLCAYAKSNIKEIYILQTSDIHSNIFGEQGWLREATLICDIIEDLGKDKVLLIDCGDTLFGDYSGVATQGQIGIDMLNLLKYDVWVPGNHDFDIGIPAFYKFLSQIKAKKLAANLIIPHYSFQPWYLFTKNGIKIAVIGMTYPWTDSLIWKDSFKNVTLTNMLPTLDKVMPDVMKHKPDIIVLAAHYWLYSPSALHGTSMKTIADKYPQIDLFLGGHVHKSVAGERVGAHSWCVVPGAHAKSLAKVCIKFNTSTHKVEDISSILISNNSSIPVNSKIKDYISKKYENKIKSMANETISILDGTIKGKSLFDLFGNAICFYSNTKLAVIAPPFENSELKDQVHVIDAFNVEPYEDSILVLNLTEKQLISVLNEQKQADSHVQKLFGAIQKGEYFYFYNGERVFKTPLQKLPVAFSSYIVASAEGRFKFLHKLSLQKNVKAYSTKLKIRTAIIKYLKKLH